MAKAVGIRGATLTHHLNGMEQAGRITRRRVPENRRVHILEITGAGEALFHRLRKAATAFDRRLRSDIDDDKVAAFEHALDRLAANVAERDRGS